MQACGRFAERPGGAAVRRGAWVAAVAVVAAVVVAGAVALSAGGQATPAARAAPANTAPVQRGKLSAVVSQERDPDLPGATGRLAVPGGQPRARDVHRAARGRATRSAAAACCTGWTTSRCCCCAATVPAYRALHAGDAGRDVRQLNRNLHVRGDDFTARTERALAALQRRWGMHVDGALALGDAVFLPGAVRIAKVTGELGGSARPGAPVAGRHLRHAPRAGEPRSVRAGSGRARRPRADHAAGQHDGDGEGRRGSAGSPRPRPGRTAAPPARPSPPRSGSTIRAKARGLDRAPVQVDITTAGRGRRPERPGHRAGRQVRRRVRGRGRARRRAARAGRRDVGLFDTGGGRVQVEGDLRAGDARRGAVVVSGEAVLELDGVTKVYGGQPPVAAPARACPSPCGGASWWRSSGRPGRASRRSCTSWGRWSGPSSGVVRIGGVDAARLGDRELSQLRARQIGFVFQQFFLAEHATVRENVADGCSTPASPPPSGTRRADEALERVGLSAPRDVQAHRSSPAASASGSRSPGRSSGARRSSSPTSRPATSTAPPARRSWRSSASSTPTAPRSS